MLLAVATRGLKQDEEWMEQLVEELLDTQVVEGWAYPGSHPDLSNTQYAAMALRAAAAAGFPSPPRSGSASPTRSSTTPSPSRASRAG